MVQIIFVVLNLHGYGKFVAAVDLGPAGNPGNQAMDSFLGPQIHQVRLVEQGRPRPYETHVAFQNAVKLRQLIQAEFPQHLADGRDVVFRIVEKMSGDGRSPRPHGPKFRHLEYGVFPPILSDQYMDGPLELSRIRTANRTMETLKTIINNRPYQNIENPFHTDNAKERCMAFYRLDIAWTF